MTDLSRWLRLHLNDGVLDGTRYVSDSTMREMHRVQVQLRTSQAFRAARLMRDTVFAFGMRHPLSPELRRCAGAGSTTWLMAGVSQLRPSMEFEGVT